MEFDMENRELIDKPENNDDILREVVGDDANDTKRKQDLSESDLDKLVNC